MSEAGATAKSPNEDPKLLRKNQLSADAQHISDLVESFISQVEIAAALPGIIQVYDTLVPEEDDLSEALEAHIVFEERLMKVKDQERETDEEQIENLFKLNKKKAKAEQDFKKSVRVILKNFRAQPEAVVKFQEEGAIQLGEGEEMLILELKTFHGHVVDRLLNPEYDDPLPELFGQNLEKNIATEEVEVAEFMTMVEDEISRLDDELKKVLTFLCLNQDTPQEPSPVPKKQESEEEEEGEEKVEDERLTALQTEIEELTGHLNDLMFANRQEEKTMLEKNVMLERETEIVTMKFNKEMKEIEDKLGLNEAGFDKEMAEMMSLEEPFLVLAEELNRIEEKRRLEEEKIEEEKKLNERRNRGATLFQALWRGHKTRKLLKAKSKGKKGKGKKGKKGKKK